MKKRPIFFFFLISFLLHFIFVFIFHKGFDSKKEIEIPQPLFVNLKQAPLPERIVDIPKPKNQEKPEKAEAQSLYDSKVDQQMVSTGKPAQSKKSVPVQAPKPKKPQEAHKKIEKKDPEKIAVGEKKQENLDFTRELPTQPKQQKIPGMPEASLGESNSNSGGDYVPGIRVGSRTYLNTNANPNIHYFVELKRKFSLTFNPVPALRGRMNEVSRGKISVMLGVSLSSTGHLANVIVIQSSGIASYDEEAIRTVKSSADFSSPPTKYLSPDNMIHMAWTFSVYL